MQFIYVLIFLLFPLSAFCQNTVVDNVDQDQQQPNYFNIVSGSWTASVGNSGVSPFYGSDYLHDGNLGSGSEVEWIFGETDPLTIYTVSAQWASHPNRASNAVYSIHHDGGVSTVAVDQRQQGGEFIALGDYVGVTKVTLENDGADGYVIADAVQVTNQGPQPPASGSAVISHWQSDYIASDNFTQHSFYFSNITDATVSVTVTLYREDSSILSDPTTDGLSGEIYVLNSQNLDETDTTNTATFDIEPKKTTIMNILRTSGSKRGWGMVSWTQASSSAEVALIAVGRNRGFRDSSGIDSFSVGYHEINRGMPF